MDAIDLQQYFPDSAVVIMRKAAGTASSRYTFKKSPSGIDNLYYGYLNINKSGLPYMWQKEYWQNNAWCTQTYGVLFMGDDKSVTEVGDWTVSTTPCTPNTVFGYRKADGSNTGLVWASAGGLSDIPEIREMSVVRQNTPGAAITDTGSKAYSKTGLIQHLDSYTLPYGRDVNGVWGAGSGTTYYDVVRIVMYHGTKTSTPVPIRCVGPISANGAYYQSYKDYNSYAIELYLAKGVGIIQENTPFIEDGSYWGMSNCNGDIFNNPGSWITYRDPS